MKIKDLPAGTVTELCRYLNIEGDGQRNWKELVTRIPGRVYTVYDISAFARAGQRAHTSPAEEVIADLITLGVTVDSLYRILHTMDARQCMQTLEEYVSPEVTDEVEALRQSDIEKATYQPEPVIGLDPADLLRDADIHPVYGPLPDLPPPTSSQRHELSKQDNYTMQATVAGSFTHTGNSSHGNHVLQGLTMSSTGDVHRFQNSVHSSQGLVGKPYETNVASVSSTLASWGAQDTDSGFHHPPPPVHSSSNFQSGIGAVTGTPSTAKYHSYQHPPIVTTGISAGNDFPPPSKGCPPQNYPYMPSGVPGTDQQLTLGATPSTHNPQQHYHQGANGSIIKQHPYSPSWPSTYSSASSKRQPSYSYTSFHNTSSSNGGVQQPMMPRPSQGHIISPSYSEGSGSSFSGTSSGYSHTGISTSSSIPNRKEEGSKDEERSVEPNILKFTYSELSEATDGFLNGMVGLGSFGTVFRAKVRGNGPFAIKKLYSQREMAGGVFYEPLYRETFTQELNMLTKYHHRNILSLVAYSNDGPTPCLVYEYMENGSLADCFQGKINISLLWKVRLNIAIQIADALRFLHTVNKPRSVLVHGDVKSANILLDAHLVPKLSDFGLARECSSSLNQSTTINTKSDIIMGTMAYLAPEFIRNKKFKPSADVYSFGVVLLELYTGQLALSDDPAHQERVLTTRLAVLIDDGSENHQDEVLMRADPKAFWPHQIGLGMFDIATVCLRHKPKLRPPMEQVLDQLHAIYPQQSPQTLETSAQNYI